MYIVCFGIVNWYCCPIPIDPATTAVLGIAHRSSSSSSRSSRRFQPQKGKSSRSSADRRHGDRNDDIVTSVVDPREDAAHDQEQERCRHVYNWEPHPRQAQRQTTIVHPRHHPRRFLPEPNDQQVIVLSQHKFNGMHVDGVHVGAGRCLLNVVVLVNVGVD